ncbi:MAG TPA: zinc dependent phospholipase C family protein [Thermodesulfobacteriota bacterium]|nr:hypothetical protein [Deltaproteobacteria bacterium]HNR12095.1 zinc dependent phospholipase C family protein [Thermodesulfobacteriota bacterium]HNU70831.1 zinc dependent phospholipase C family protein [Thermodesulfobacteriota bacterium]HOC39667.1 zinc dependent phospholipase C family protein [Thermodesulfobacteriota bacterium]
MMRGKALAFVPLLLLAWTADQVAEDRCAHGWSGSTHAFIAATCLNVSQVPLASYNARMGSLVPDFFWYLEDTGQLDPASADQLHGFDALPDLDPETILYQTVTSALHPWNIDLSFFAEGIKTHVFADIAVHNLFDGYLEGNGMWVDMLQARTGQTNRMALHLALEFAVDALLIQDVGSFQLHDLVRAGPQAALLENAVNQITLDTNTNLTIQFNRYLSLMRRLEKLAGRWGPYLSGNPAPVDLYDETRAVLLSDGMPGPLSRELNDYLSALEILRNYPSEIYQTLTVDMNWQDVLLAVIETWNSEAASKTAIK